MDILPITRLEYDIDAIINDHSVIDPVTRIEQMLSDIKDGTPTAIEPVTRIETYLAKISGVSVELPEPVTRIEMYLANIAGMDIELPNEPVTRLEGLLEQWAEGSGSLVTLTGTIVSFVANASKAINSLVVTIASESGVTGANVYVTGKNHFTTTGETAGYFLDSDCEELASSSWNCSDYIAVLPSTQYTFNPGTTAGNSAKIWYFDISKNPISYIASGEQTFTTPSNCAFMRFSYRASSADIQLELGSTSTEYEAFSGTTYSANFNSTVYSGTYDFVSGVLTTGGNEYQLTGQTINTLSGGNNIWSDAGDVSVTIPSNIIVT